MVSILNNKVSPIILQIIIILAIILIISGLLHLLVKFLFRPPNRDPDEINNSTVLQGQLQQLFQLHDAGVDQSSIDTLPVFNYKSILGVKKNSFDCAVCLCGFEPEDKLRLLPICSHAFHMNCIDIWLLSHSTCPLCRESLILDFSPNCNSPPIFRVLESGIGNPIEVVSDDEVGLVNSQLSDDFRANFGDLGQNSGEICVLGVENENQTEIVGLGEKVVPIKLGRYRSVDSGFERSGNSNSEVRRCFSMGSSFAYYVMDENSSLKVPIKPPMKKQLSGNKFEVSECGVSDSRRGLFNDFEAFRVLEIQSGGNDNKFIVRDKRESFSVSKIWLRGKKDEANLAESSRRAFSSRFPMHRNVLLASGGGLDF